MLSSMTVTGLLVAALGLVNAVSAISTLSVVGSKFFTEEGDQFYIKGVAYQLTPHDPLIDNQQCTLDAALMKELGANTIRVYHVDPSGDHKDCMDTFANAGIYLFVDLDDFPTQISQDEPHWNSTQLNAFKIVLDEFQQYDNTAGVFVGNEVLTMANGSEAAPYILSAARDIKAYRDSKNYRKIPVGYSAADIGELRPMLQNYLVCRPEASERLDFYSLNAYEWCGPDSSYSVSGYDQLQKNATNYPVPIFLSETGCNTVPPRDFADQAAIFGPDMSGTWSGSIIYEWIEEKNNYGLITYGHTANATDLSPSQAEAAPDGFSRSGTPTPVLPDFTNLKSQWATLTPSGVALSAYSASISQITPPPCPTATPGGWVVDASASLPSLGQTANTASQTATGAQATGSGSSANASASGSASHKGDASRLAPAGSGSSLFGVAVAALAGLGLGVGVLL